MLKYQKCNQYYLIKIKLVFLININFNLVFQSIEKLYYWTGKVSKGHSIINNMIKRKKEILHQVSEHEKRIKCLKLIINQKYRSISGQTLRDIIYATCQTCFYQQLVIPVSEHLYFLAIHTKPCFLPDYKENQDNL